MKTIQTFIGILLLLSLLFFGCAAGPEEKVPEENSREEIEPEEEKGAAEKGPSPEELRLRKEKEADAAIEEYIKRGETEKALKVFEDVYDIDDISGPDDLRMYGLLLISNGEFEKAGDAFEKALAESPGDTEILYNLSLIEGAMGNTEKQRELLEKIISEDPEHVEAQTSLGSIYLQKKEPKEAKAAFQKAMKSDESFIPARMGYASLLLKEKQYGEAEKELSTIIELDPNNALAYVDRSKARLALKKREAAVEDLSKAVELEPENFWNYLDRGRIRLRIGETTKALEDFTKAIELNPDNFFPYAYRAGIYEKLGRTDDALRDFETVISLREDYYFAYSSLGSLYYMKEKWLDAGIYFAKAYMYEEDVTTYAMLSALCLFRGDNDKEAKDYLHEVIQSVPKENIFYHLMRLYLDKSYELNFLSKIDDVKDKQEQGMALFFLAAYYDMQGQKRLSQTYYLEVIDKLPPESIEYRLASWETKEEQL